MERLTKRDGGGNARMNCDDCDLGSSGRCGILQCRNQFIHRLAAYEDTGLEPEEVDQIRRAAQTMMFPTVADFVRYAIQNFEDLQKYRKAESEDRLLVLPCKVGDMVFYIRGQHTVGDTIQRHDFFCKKCNIRADYFIRGEGNWWSGYAPNYCPNCGVKMDGGVNDGKADN